MSKVKKNEFHGSLGISLVNNTLLLWLLHSIILNPLEEDRINMVRLLLLIFSRLLEILYWNFFSKAELELDPSQIVSIPLNTGIVLKFTMYSFGVNFALSIISFYISKRPSSTSTNSSCSSLLKRVFVHALFLGTLCGTLFIFVCVHICGASPMKNVILTMLSSLYISSTTIARAYISSENIGGKFDDIFYSLVLVNSDVSHFQMSLQFVLYFTFFGTMIATILLTFDWGAQVQRWPVPILLGCTYGNSVGIILSVIYASYIKVQRLRRTKTKTN